MGTGGDKGWGNKLVEMAQHVIKTLHFYKDAYHGIQSKLEAYLENFYTAVTGRLSNYNAMYSNQHGSKSNPFGLSIKVYNRGQITLKTS